jgi:xanthosine utilization system XapX-like protein
MEPTATAPPIPWSKRFEAGIVAGVVAAILMMGFLTAYSGEVGIGAWIPLQTLSGLVYGVQALLMGSVAMLTGAAITLGFGIVLGIIFALLESRRPSRIGTLIVGIIVGMLIFVAMELYVLPVADPTMAARIAPIPLGFFIANVLFGIGLGLTAVFLRAFSGIHKDRRMERPMRAAV